PPLGSVGVSSKGSRPSRLSAILLASCGCGAARYGPRHGPGYGKRGRDRDHFGPLSRPRRKAREARLLALALLADAHGDAHGRALEAELLAEAALQEAAVAVLQEAGGEKDDHRRAGRRLRGEEHARQTATAHRRGHLLQHGAQPGVQ